MYKLRYIVAGCGAATIVWGIAFSRHMPSRSQVIAEATLQERWDDAVQGTVPYDPGPRVIPIVKIIPEPAEVKPPKPPEKPEEKKTSHKEESTKRDICSVHRMRKVYISKHRWRCRK